MTMQPAALVWPGWTGTMVADGTQYRVTWDEWRAQQRKHLQRWQVRNTDQLPGQREVAARAFLAWFDAASSDRHTSPIDDRELAVRHFMRSFEEVAATLDHFKGTELAR